MLYALRYAIDDCHGNLHRHRGGLWGAPERGHIRTSTIRGLVSRGLAEYTKHRTGPRGEFPIEVRITAKGRKELNP